MRKVGKSNNSVYFFAMSLERRDLRRAALFWWITCIFTALSSVWNTTVNCFVDGVFLMSLTTLRTNARFVAVSTERFLSCLSFLSACAVIGIGESISEFALSGQG